MSNAAHVELTILDAQGKEVRRHKALAEIFNGRVSDSILHETVRWQRAKRRAGTHSVQTRAEMTGGGAKPWKQKGTGRARAGSNTSAIWVGGGVAHGPKPRSYEFRLNKRERRQALMGALSARQKEGRLILVDSFSIAEPKTKDAERMLQSIGVPKRATAVVVVPDGEAGLEKSLRNISGVKVILATGVNVYDILRAKYLVVIGQALEGLESRLAKA